MKWLLGPENKCNLWSKFDCLLSYLGAFEESSASIVDKLMHCIKTINEIIERESAGNKSASCSSSSHGSCQCTPALTVSLIIILTITVISFLLFSPLL